MPLTTLIHLPSSMFAVACLASYYTLRFTRKVCCYRQLFHPPPTLTHTHACTHTRTHTQICQGSWCSESSVPTDMKWQSVILAIFCWIRQQFHACCSYRPTPRGTSIEHFRNITLCIFIWNIVYTRGLYIQWPLYIYRKLFLSMEPFNSTRLCLRYLCSRLI